MLNFFKSTHRLFCVKSMCHVVYDIANFYKRGLTYVSLSITGIIRTRINILDFFV